MPTYDYKCPKCDWVEAWIFPFEHEPPECTKCCIPMKKQVTAPAQIGVKGTHKGSHAENVDPNRTTYK